MLYVHVTMTRFTIKAAITEPPPSGLGYCCIYAFFCHHKRTGMIADLLGVTRGPVKKHKARVRAGLEKCDGCPNCHQKRGALKGKSPPR